MMVVRWTETAEEDLDQIYRFYKRESLRTAKNITAAIQKGAKRLEIFPRMAPIESSLSEFTRVYRSLTVMRLFKIVYFVDESKGEVVVVDIWDCRQDPGKLKERIGI
jgi:plasmid stabilization system protein ParE